jgi:hypothetical protein
MARDYASSSFSGIYCFTTEILIAFLLKYENGLQAYVQAYQITLSCVQASCHKSEVVSGGRTTHTSNAINRLEVGDVFTLQKKKVCSNEGGG